MNAELLSLVVVAYEMRRELPRVLHSLSRRYQRDVDDLDYEVVVVDNGSSKPFTPEFVRSFGEGFRLVVMDDPKPSPVEAVNHGARLARGKRLGIMIDGARLTTPGVLAYAARAFRAFDEPIVEVPGLHLGSAYQNLAHETGYDRKTEDGLLASVDWRNNGYRLFEIAVLDPCAALGLFFPPMESNCLFVRRSLFEAVGGYEPRFDLPGGGLANLDFFQRLCAAPGTELVRLLGEGTFHQIHGGTSERRSVPWETCLAQYRAIRGREYVNPHKPASFLGSLPASYMDVLRRTVEQVETVRSGIASGRITPRA